MIRVLGLAVTLMCSSVFASVQTTHDLVSTISMNQMTMLQSQVVAQGLNWKVGDTNNYNVDMGFIKGTMVMKVREITPEGLWIDQDVDLGFAGKQNASMLIDQNTGEIKKMLVNGKEQSVPKQDIEVIEIKEDKITVPAGTFECIHARLRDKGQNQEINTWINPQQIPLSGMLKTIQPSQFGNVTILLKSFIKN